MSAQRVSVSDMDPEHLKAQGNECFRRRNDRGALEKYNAALGVRKSEGTGWRWAFYYPS